MSNFNEKIMEKFLRKTGLLVVEEKEFKQRVIEKLGWSERMWWVRLAGKQELTASERIALEHILQDIRAEDKKND